MDPVNDRIIEVAAIEYIDRRATGRTAIYRVNPGVPIGRETTAVHGITDADVRDCPTFQAIVDDLLAFLGQDLGGVIGHNLDFDMRFLDAECVRAGRRPASAVVEGAARIDTLRLARDRGGSGSMRLAAVAERLDIRLDKKKLHGSEYDATLAAKVWLQLTVEQRSLLKSNHESVAEQPFHRLTGLKLVVVRATVAENAAHERRLDELLSKHKACLYREVTPDAPSASSHQLDGHDVNIAAVAATRATGTPHEVDGFVEGFTANA